MQGRELFDKYLEGWRTGDGALSLSMTAPGFYYDDPDTGRVRREEFLQFVEDFKTAGAGMAGGQVPTPFLQYSDLTLTGENPSTAWCWWRVSGSSFQAPPASSSMEQAYSVSGLPISPTARMKQPYGKSKPEK